MNKIVLAIALFVFGLLGIGPANAQAARFSYKGESLPGSILRPWIEPKSQADYAGHYRFESPRYTGELLVNSYLRNGSAIPKDFILDAVKIGPAMNFEKKPVKTFEGFFVGEGGEVRVGGKDVMRACYFVHPKSQKRVQGFLVGGAFFGKE